MKLKVEIDEDRVYVLDLREDLKINEADLDDHLSKQPELFAKYGWIQAQARAKLERAEGALEEHEYKLDLELRKKKDEEKLTENQIKAMVKTDEHRLKLAKKVMRAREQAEIVGAAKEAFAQRKDCLISFAANRRAEYETGLSIKKRRQD